MWEEKPSFIHNRYCFSFGKPRNRKFPPLGHAESTFIAVKTESRAFPVPDEHQSPAVTVAKMLLHYIIS